MKRIIERVLMGFGIVCLSIVLMAASNIDVSDDMLESIQKLTAMMVPLGAQSCAVTPADDAIIAMTNCRALTCVSGTTIKVTYGVLTPKVDTQVVVLPAGLLLIPIRNVRRVWSTGTDATQIYALR